MINRNLIPSLIPESVLKDRYLLIFKTKTGKTVKIFVLRFLFGFQTVYTLRDLYIGPFLAQYRYVTLNITLTTIMHCQATQSFIIVQLCTNIRHSIGHYPIALHC